MKLNDREEPFTPICTTENVPLFVMYIKEELPEKQKSKLEAHLSHCADCKMNLAYVKEILGSQHAISLDEKTLLLKYLTDPLFYYFANNIRKKVLEDVKKLLQEASIEVKKMSGSGIDNNKSKASRPLTKLQQVPYPYFVLTTSIILFLSLGISIVLALSSKYPTLQSYLPFSKPNSLVVEERLPSNLNSDLSIDLTKTTENNRYQQLDTAIDEFLSTQNREHLAKAEIIAKDIQLFYEDNYGVDLVNYYKSIPLSVIDKLAFCRKEMFDLVNSSPGDHYQQKLSQAQKLEKDLFSLGAVIEGYRARIITNKFYVLLFNYEMSEKSREEAIKFCTNNNYLFLKAHFLLWKAKELSTSTSFSESEMAFQEAILISEKLSLSDLIVNAKTSLSMLYHLNNYNEKSLALSQSLLAKTDKLNKDKVVALLQLCGLSSFSLQYYELSESYLKESLNLAIEIKNPVFLARAYLFLSITSSEAGNYQQSDDYHSKAMAIVEELEDKTSRLTTLFAITGYYAKSKARQGDFSESAIAYKQTLETVSELGLKNNLIMSQLNEGLAIALKELNNASEAKHYVATANQYRKLASNNNEKANCLLSFVPQPCFGKY